MKTIFTFFLIFFSISTILISQPILKWDVKYNGPTADDFGNKIVVDDEGNVYVTGASDGIASKDYFTIKYNNLGTVLWSARYNGTANGEDEASAILLDRFGNVYVTGKSEGINSEFDIVTVKYNADGEEQWVNRFNSTLNKDDIGSAMVIDVFGNLYVCGSSGSGVAGVVLKIDITGMTSWFVFQNNAVITNNILINNNGRIVISTGLTKFTFALYELNPNNGSIISSYNNQILPVIGFPSKIILDNIGNIYVLYYSFAGSINPVVLGVAKFTQGVNNSTWSRSKVISGSYFVPTDIKLDKNLNVYVVSDRYANRHQYFLWKINSLGNVVWENSFNSNTGNFDDIPVSLAINSLIDNPDIYTTGYTSNGNIITSKFDNDGNLLWSQSYDCGNNGTDIAAAMVMDRCENIYITGYSSCSGTFKDVKTIKYSTLDAPVITSSQGSELCVGTSTILSTSLCQGCTYTWSNGETTSSIVVSPDTTTDYTVSVKHPSACELASLLETIIVNPLLTPGVTIHATSTSICAGDNVVFNVSPLNGGNAPSYQWYVDNVLQSENGNSFSTSDLLNGSEVFSMMTSNAICLNQSNALSNTISFTVHSLLTAMIIPDGPTTFCQGGSVNLTASEAQSYEWSSGQTSRSVDVTSQGVFSVTITDINGCSAISSEILVEVNPLLIPAVAITPSVNAICAGDNITFTSTATNGGTAPTYQWFINGDLQVETGPVFSTTTLKNNDQILCQLNSNAECLSRPTAQSNTISVTVNPLLTPEVSINTSSTSILSCQSVTFTAAPTHGGITPTYQWFLNGDQVGSTSTFTSADLIDGAQISCLMTSTATCKSSPFAESNIITMSVSPLPQPSIEVSGDTISSANYKDTQYEYNWYFNGNEISASPFILCTQYGSGSYYLVINFNGCTDTSNTMDIVCTVSTKDIDNQHYFIVYPNPTNSILNIYSKNISSGELRIVAYNLLGQEFEEQRFSGLNDKLITQFDMSGYVNGIYTIAVYSDKHRQVFKVFKIE